MWQPVQQLEWIGLFWNSKMFSITIPIRRIQSCKESISSVLHSLHGVSARQLAICTGKLVSMMPVVGNVVRLMTRYLYAEILSRRSWDGLASISSSNRCVSELNFWIERLDKLNHRLLTVHQQTHTVVYSDASSTGCGAFIVETPFSVFHDTWDSTDRAKSSTYRELKAIYLAMSAYVKFLQNRSVKWYSDSQTCVHIINVGSSKQELHDLALNIFRLCFDFNIHLKVQWVPRDLNVVADSISKVRDTDDWEVSMDFFKFMDGLWGPHDIDRFATNRNRKTLRYNSKFCDINTEAVDCFTQNWSGCNNWLVPPIAMVSKTILHLLSCNAHGTIIVPKWPSAAFWPMIFKANFVKQDFVLEVLEFNAQQGIFVKNENNCIFSSRRFSSKVLAIRL